MYKSKKSDYINEFPEQIQKRIIPGSFSSIGSGWLQIVIELDEKLTAIDSKYLIHQIKEKFGELCFYVSSDKYDQMRELIEKAELLSAETCEICGCKGKLRFSDWRVTRCDQHAPISDK